MCFLKMFFLNKFENTKYEFEKKDQFNKRVQKNKKNQKNKDNN
jgi:hypothetical protein